MRTLFRCTNGHEWQADSAPGASPPCPVCGASDTMAPSPSFPASRPPLAFTETTTLTVVQPPPALARYEVLDKLGEGGMGIVYKARDRDADRVVALKVIRRERLGSPELLDRFRREALASARVQHTNIVRVYDADVAGETPYIAMELIDGLTLQKLVEQLRPGLLPIGRVCDFIRQAALGLGHAADQQLVHRDIKPSNLMVLSPTGIVLPPRPVIKLLDLGVARVLDQSLHTLTRDGSVIGTPDFMAPEQADDPRKADVRSDLYSLGCTFYFLLSGEVPFPGGTLFTKFERHRSHAPRSVDSARPEVSAALASIIRRLMAKHPDDRFQTPGELAAALDTLLRTGDVPGWRASAPLEQARVLAGHTGPVVAVTFLPDGSLLSSSADRTLRLWDATTGKEKRLIGPRHHAVGPVAVLPGGQVLAGHGVTLRGWDLTGGRELYQLAGHTNAVRCLAVSRDGKRAVSGADDHTVRVWDLEVRREVVRFTKHRGAVTGVVLTPDGKQVLSSSRDGSLRLWELRGGREVRSFAAPPGPALGVALMPDGQSACSCHFDTTLRLWDLETGQQMCKLSGHKQMVGALAVAATGEVVSGSHDQTVRVWAPASGTELGCGQGHSGPVTAVALSADGRWIASGGMDGAVRVWRMVE